MEIFRTQSFEKDFKKLPQHIQKQFERKIGLFIQNPFHPSLQSKKMEGEHSLWEVRITQNYRFTFSKVGECIYIRRIGIHDILLRP